LAPSIDDEQILAVCGKPLIPKVGQQAQDRGGILRRSQLDSQNVLLALTINAHGADNVMLGKTLPIDVEREFTISPA